MNSEAATAALVAWSKVSSACKANEDLSVVPSMIVTGEFNASQRVSHILCPRFLHFAVVGRVLRCRRRRPQLRSEYRTHPSP